MNRYHRVLFVGLFVLAIQSHSSFAQCLFDDQGRETQLSSIFGIAQQDTVRDYMFYKGDFEFTGYLQLEHKDEDPDIDWGHPEHIYAKLIILACDQPDFLKWMGQAWGEQAKFWGGGEFIGLGCYDEEMGTISYSNTASDMISGQISGEYLSLLQKSSEHNPVVIKAHKNPATESGVEYNFSSFSIINVRKPG